MNVMSPPFEAFSIPLTDNDLILSGVCEIAEVLAESLPLPGRLEAVVHILARSCSLRNGLISILDDGGTLHPLIAAGGDAAEIADRTGIAFLREIGSLATPLVAHTSAQGGRANSICLGTPLKRGDVVIGTLSALQLRQHAQESASGDQLRVLTVVPQFAVLAFEDLQLCRHIRRHPGPLAGVDLRLLPPLAQ